MVNIKSDVCDQPSAFFGGDFSRSFSSDRDFSGDFDFRTAFFSLSADLEGANSIKFSKHVAFNCFMGGLPDAVEHRLFLGWWFGDGPLCAHNFTLVLFFSCLAVFVLIRLGSTIFP